MSPIRAETLVQPRINSDLRIITNSGPATQILAGAPQSVQNKISPSAIVYEDAGARHNQIKQDMEPPQL